MKTLIIAGSVQTHSVKGLIYNVALFGQTYEHPLCIYITELTIETSIGYTEVEEICRVKYAEYFSTDLFNIISVHRIIHIN